MKDSIEVKRHIFKCNRGRCMILRSEVLSLHNTRYVVTDVNDTNRILLDGNGVGFKTVVAAQNAVKSAKSVLFDDNGNSYTESERKDCR